MQGIMIPSEIWYDDGNNMKKDLPIKVLWYLSVHSWFKCLFANTNDAENLTWHANGRKYDGLLPHVFDLT